MLYYETNNLSLRDGLKGLWGKNTFLSWSIWSIWISQVTNCYTSWLCEKNSLLKSSQWWLNSKYKFEYEQCKEAIPSIVWSTRKIGKDLCAYIQHFRDSRIKTHLPNRGYLWGICRSILRLNENLWLVSVKTRLVQSVLV